MGRKLKVAAIQMDCTPAPVTQRLARLAPQIEKVAQAGAELVVLPELFNTGYEFHERNYRLAERIDGATVTWMKAQAAQYDIHLSGTLLLLDDADIYNAGILVSPDGNLWRYDKRYPAFWERAYFRGGDHITIADTKLGKLGMLICWDQHHPNLWADYVGQVDAMLVMSCPGDIASGDLIFPDGFRAKFMELAGAHLPANETDAPAEPPIEAPTQHHAQAAWMGIPVIEAAATGIVNTKLPLIENYFPGTPFADRIEQASEMRLECGFPAATQIVNAQGETLVSGTASNDKIIMAEIELPDTRTKPENPQPSNSITPEMYALSDEIVPAMMMPLYEKGIKQD